MLNKNILDGKWQTAALKQMIVYKKTEITCDTNIDVIKCDLTRFKGLKVKWGDPLWYNL